MEAGNGGKSTNRTSKVKLLTVVFIILVLAPIILSAYLYYLPLKDVEVKVDHSYWTREDGHDYIALKLNVTNKGIISHTVRFTVRVVFVSQPDMVFTQSTSWWEISPSDWHLEFFAIYVHVPNELSLTPYEASISFTLIPFFNEYSAPWIVSPGVVWLVALAAVLTSLVRNRRQTR